MLQSFDEIKLYVAPRNFKASLSGLNTTNTNTTSSTATTNGNITSLTKASTETAAETSKTNQAGASPSIHGYPNSAKLPRRNESTRGVSTTTTTNNATNEAVAAAAETSEIDFRDILDQIFDNISTHNVSDWFKSAAENQPPHQQPRSPPRERASNGNNTNGNNESPSFQTPESPLSAASSPLDQTNLYDAIQYALTHIDFNLKRNSDFINELTKLLDTSRAIKQEAQLKKVLKLLEEEKSSQQAAQTMANLCAPISNQACKGGSVSQPASPKLSAPNANQDTDERRDDSVKKRPKYKSFKGFSSGFSASPKLKPKELSSNANANANSVPTIQYNGGSTSTTTNTASTVTSSPAKFLSSAGNGLCSSKAQSSKDLTGSSIELNFQRQLLLYNQHNEVNNSDYIELEFEIEKISYNLDKLVRNWSKLKSLNHVWVIFFSKRVCYFEPTVNACQLDQGM